MNRIENLHKFSEQFGLMEMPYSPGNGNHEPLQAQLQIVYVPLAIRYYKIEQQLSASRQQHVLKELNPGLCEGNWLDLPLENNPLDIVNNVS